MKAFNTLFVLAAVLLVVLFGISVLDCRPMYAVNNAPPYGPPVGGIMMGGLLLLFLLLPNWLKGMLLFAMACVVALVAIIGDAFCRMIPRRPSRTA